MDFNQRIEHVLEKLLHQEGYDIVRVRLSGQRQKTLQIMIERLDGQGITLDDCEKVSHLVSPVLDVENFIDERYHLEVSSPGLDRPLVKPKDFQRFQGSHVSIQTNYPIKNRKNFKGILAFVSETGIKVTLTSCVDDQVNELELSYPDIRSACLDEINLIKN